MTVLLSWYVNKWSAHSINENYSHYPELTQFNWVFWKMFNKHQWLYHWYKQQMMSLHTLKSSSWINPTMNGVVHLVLIWGRTCRMLSVDKGKALAGDKGTRMDEHGPKIRQGRMEYVQTNVYAYERYRSTDCTRSKRQMNNPSKKKTKDCFCAIGSLVLVVR